MLQWGRNFIVAETRRSRDRVLLPLRASMGPQLYRCGNSPCASGTPRRSGCFNGAATLSLRKRGPRSRRSSGHTCFNGAATLSLRKQPPGAPTVLTDAMLQWGRNFIVAETMVGLGDDVTEALASMGPQLYRCGNTRHLRRSWGGSFRLQWGRNFIVAETLHVQMAQSTGMALLQWGRNFIVAETGRLQRTVWEPRHASMGPQLYRCGNPAWTTSSCSADPGFNGAATLSLRKQTCTLYGGTS